MEDHLLGNIIRSNAAAIALGALALASVIPSSSALAQGQPAAAPQAAPAQKGEAYGNWGLLCSSKEPKACLIQIAVANKDKKIVAGMILSQNAGKQSLVAIVPLGIRLKDGVVLTVDGGNQTRGEYAQCITSGCRAAIPVTDALLKAMSTGKQVTLTVKAPGDKDIPFNIDIKGFADAKAALDKKTR